MWTEKLIISNTRVYLHFKVTCIGDICAYVRKRWTSCKRSNITYPLIFIIIIIWIILYAILAVVLFYLKHTKSTTISTYFTKRGYIDHILDLMLLYSNTRPGFEPILYIGKWSLDTICLTKTTITPVNI